MKARAPIFALLTAAISIVGAILTVADVGWSRRAIPAIAAALYITFVLFFPFWHFETEASKRRRLLRWEGRFERIARRRRDYPREYLPEALRIYRELVESGRIRTRFWTGFMPISEVRYRSADDHTIEMLIEISWPFPFMTPFWRTFHEVTHIVDYLKTLDETGEDIFFLEQEAKASPEKRARWNAREKVIEKRVRAWANPRLHPTAPLAILEWLLLSFVTWGLERIVAVARWFVAR